MYKYLCVITAALLAGAAWADIPLQSTPGWSWSTEDRAYGGLVFLDADDDGDLDLATGCYDGSNWYPPVNDYHNSIFYNTAGTLASSPSWTSSVERHTGEIDAGDINGDGVPDIFAANGGSSYQPNSVYYGATGGPATSPDWSSSSAAWATGSCLGDIDGDGDVDAATSNQGRDQYDPYRPVYIFWNSGTALATGRGWESSEAGVFSGVCLGDVDGAHFTEVKNETLVGDGSRQVFYLAHAPLLRIDGVRINGAGLGNAYAYDLYAGWISFCRPLGNGETAEIDYTYSTRLDVAVAKWSNFDTCVYLNDAGMPATTPGWTSGNASRTDRSVIFFDYDRDGDQDLFVAGSNDYLRIYANEGGTLGATPAWTSAAEVRVNEALIGDFNGDGYQDLVIANTPYRGLSVWENNAGSIDTSPTWSYTGSAECRAIAVGDVNGDGALDIAAGFSRNPLVVFLNDYTVGVEVTAFRAAGRDDAALLSWQVRDGRAGGFDLLRKSADSDWGRVNDGRITGESPYSYVDAGLAPGEYSYKLVAYDLSGRSSEHGPITCDVGGAKTAFALHAAAPNPCRGSVTFSFSLAEGGPAEVTVYDLAGRRVATPVSRSLAAGENAVSCELDLAPGVYVYRLEAGGRTSARKLVVSK
ncbi:MAG: FG-GAP-like repeat-containing protein [Candidatus Zixiibacteriota bacterium]|jgi:hypothetical protein